MNAREHVRQDWSEFTRNLMSKNRFFVDPLYRRTLEKTFKSHAGQLPKGQIIFRARINDSEHLGKAYPIENMYAPDHTKTSFGRANPIGIPYLYTALSKRICIHEIRPSKLQEVTIAQFKLVRELNIINLENSIPLGANEYLNELAMKIQIIFSKTIAYGKPEIEYLPYQYIAELIKNSGYDGILYRSNFSKDICQEDEVNLVLFNQEAVESFVETELVTITSVEITYS